MTARAAGESRRDVCADKDKSSLASRDVRAGTIPVGDASATDFLPFEMINPPFSNSST